MPPQNAPQPQPVPTPESGSWALIACGAVVVILLASGALAYLYYPSYFPAPQALEESALEQTPNQAASTNEDAIESDLDATASESSSADLDALENSL